MMEVATPKVLISVLNWNAVDLTIKCLSSLSELAYKNTEIVVVDNASKEGEANKIQLHYPDITVIRNQRNSGFAGGHNQAIQMAIDRGFDFVWLVNNDCRVQSSDLGKLLAAAADPKVGIVSPVIALPEVTGEERLQFVGSWFDWKTQSCIRPKDPDPILRREREFPNEMWVTGTAMLLRCEMLKRIGGLDERYFAYFEDNDLGARASRAGYLSRMAFDVTVLHQSFATTHDRPPHYFYLCNRNAYLFWIENTPKEFRAGIRRRLMARSLLEAQSLHRAGLEEHARACVVGLIDAIRGHFGSIKTRFQTNLVNVSIVNLLPYRLLDWLNR
ncbi:MAG: glycosyltransferase family 2 protein [Candidatus Accumulibacter sp.]|uniref:Glycosyltransferase family 2 protein n=1 Tax=Candidatus Accumulibacter affinis TaxID=2954384 RepID=A0A935T8U1_9PROT|nr:glycosyltransferase family 2 protein [Candidatus Accumulibacter affinis]